MIVKESIRRDIARLVVWYPVRWLVGILPLTLSFQLFRTLARLHMTLQTRSVQPLRENILDALPDLRNPDDVIKTYLENHYTDRLHIFTYPRIRKTGELNRICSLEGQSNLDEALTRDRGAIIVLGHCGPIQIPLFLLGRKGYDIIQVGLPTDSGLSWIGRHTAFKLRMKYERMIPARILPADEFLRPLFVHLKRNAVVMMNIDPAGGGRWIGRLHWLPFFNKIIPFPMGWAFLAEKTRAPVVPLSIHRSEDKRYVFRLHPPICNDTAETPEIRVGKMVAWYESIVRQDPGLWHFWDEFEEGKLIRSHANTPKPINHPNNPIR